MAKWPLCRHLGAIMARIVCVRVYLGKERREERELQAGQRRPRTWHGLVAKERPKRAVGKVSLGQLLPPRQVLSFLDTPR